MKFLALLGTAARFLKVNIFKLKSGFIAVGRFLLKPLKSGATILTSKVGAFILKVSPSTHKAIVAGTTKIKTLMNTSGLFKLIASVGKEVAIFAGIGALINFLKPSVLENKDVDRTLAELLKDSIIVDLEGEQNDVSWDVIDTTGDGIPDTIQRLWLPSELPIMDREALLFYRRLKAFSERIKRRDPVALMEYESMQMLANAEDPVALLVTDFVRGKVTGTYLYKETSKLDRIVEEV